MKQENQNDYNLNGNCLNSNDLNNSNNNYQDIFNSSNNQNFNQGMSVNNQLNSIQSQSIYSYNQSTDNRNSMVGCINNSIESNNSINSTKKNKQSKKKIVLIIGILIVIIVSVIVCLFVFSGTNTLKNNDGIIKNENSIKVGNVKINVLSNENEIDNSGLYKVGDEYIFKGGDLYSKKYEDGRYSTAKKLGNIKNFVLFNDNYWRIIKINSDGTIKLVWAGRYQLYDEIINENDLYIMYAETDSNDLKYENSYLREYLNNTFINDTSIIPSNYSDYLVKSNWDISTYNEFDYDIYSYKDSENIVNKQMSSFEDYIGILSISDFCNAKIDGNLPPKGGYYNNYIVDILESTGSSYPMEVNTSNVIVDGNNNSIGVAKFSRYNGNWFIITNSKVDRSGDVLPVITLKSNIIFESGDGSVENPYIVKK